MKKAEDPQTLGVSDLTLGICGPIFLSPCISVCKLS